MEIDKATAILSGKDELSEKYFSRDYPDLNLRREVDEAFAKAYPGSLEIGNGNNLPVHLNDAMNEEAAKLGLAVPTTLEVTQPVTQPQTQPETQPTETTEQTDTVQSYSPLWDTPKAEALTSYKAVYGSDYEPGMVADAKAIFDGFVEEYVGRQGTSEAKAHVAEYVDQLMRRMGNHPLNAQFLRYVGHRLSYFAK